MAKQELAMKRKRILPTKAGPAIVKRYPRPAGLKPKACLPLLRPARRAAVPPRGGGPRARRSGRRPSKNDDDVLKDDALSESEQKECAEASHIRDPKLMFRDIVQRMPELGAFARELGRELRVATMCSGTESPVLALHMMGTACGDLHGAPLKTDHVFSCEIEPFKQAYIERNFAPPILFRDVVELGGQTATTAYGAQVVVPGQIDLLIAGTSCVDYSNLNEKKEKCLKDTGESGQTFDGMMQWIDKHKPPLVIMENVCSAPWAEIAEVFDKRGYHAQFTRLDTKRYYIPHTRTRVYLMAVLKKGSNSDLPKQWVEKVKQLERPTKLSMEAFLVPSDDPRLHAARAKLADKGEARADRAIDWNRCESRHAKCRDEEDLGQKRPYTSWGVGSRCQLPDYAWEDWARGKPERVLDLMDIEYLRLTQRGIDPAFKTLVWNLSQNADRSSSSVKPGTCPCLTPSMIPFVTSRGGPLIGLEALSLQGIPIDDLLLTRQSEDEMASLAGNAMTSTVVGVCIAAALVLAKEQVIQRRASRSSALCPRASAFGRGMSLSSIGGQSGFLKRPLKLQSLCDISCASLLKDAKSSSQFCISEGQDAVVNSLVCCKDCGHTVSKKLSGVPVHNFEPLNFAPSRITPSEFRRTLMALLPMRLSANGFEKQSLLKLKPESCEAELWDTWLTAITRVRTIDFSFQRVTRGTVWTAFYQAPGAKLVLTLDPHQCRWHLFLTPTESNGLLDEILLRPVARMRIAGKSLLHGKWQINLPSRETFGVSIRGSGKLVDTHAAKIGLESELVKTRFTQYTVSVPVPKKALLDEDISGTYVLLENCGGAMGSLHVRKETSKVSRPFYFFLDPTRSGQVQEDSFVFAQSHGRLAFGEGRGHVAELDPTWREPAGNQVKPTPVDCIVLGRWVDIMTASISTISDRNVFLSCPSGEVSVKLSATACRAACALVSCSVPLRPGYEAGELWPVECTQLPLDRSKAIFDQLAWLTNRIRVPAALNDWCEIEVSNEAKSLTTTPAHLECAPKKPKVIWSCPAGSKRLKPCEDPHQAAEYERNLKQRPPPFVVEIGRNKTEGKFQIAVNAVALAHTALADLPRALTTGLDARSLKFAWRVYESENTGLTKRLDAFKFRSNRHDMSAQQPPSFERHLLRPEQLRSLAWMLKQETTEEAYMETEVAEAALGALKWRAEARVQLPRLVRGGVLADQVGYGKTAIMLGLIDSHRGPEPPPALSADHKSIPTNASLIVVPPHLMRQWPSEVRKFTGDSLRMIEIRTVADLKNVTMLDVKGADLVICANTVLHSNVYFEQLAKFAGISSASLSALTGASDRHFAVGYADALQRFGERVAQKYGFAKETRMSDTKEQYFETSRRLRGAALRKGPMKAVVVSGKPKGSGPHSALASKRPAAAILGKVVKRLKSDTGCPVPGRTPARTVCKKGSPAKERKRKVDIRSKRRAHETHTGMLLLEMFCWGRVVIDEYTYLSPRDRTMLGSLKASARWCLSGTPMLETFSDVKEVASLLDVHLGVEENLAAKKFDRTQAETFEFYREVHTDEWHARRHKVAQDFIDRFFRQNIAEIDEIRADCNHVHVQLTPIERGLYLELDNHLQVMELKSSKKMPRRGGSEGGSLSRVLDALGNSGSADEALLKKCVHYQFGEELGSSQAIKACGTVTAAQACTAVLRYRESRIKNCEEEILLQVREAHHMLAGIHSSEPSVDTALEPFYRWLEGVASEAKDGYCGDPLASGKLRQIVAQKVPRPSKQVVLKGSEATQKKAENASKASSDKGPQSKRMSDARWALREQTHKLRRLVKELVSRVRSKRYFEELSRLLGENGNRPDTSIPQALLSCCGHKGAKSIVQKHAQLQECATPRCLAKVLPVHVLPCREIFANAYSATARPSSSREGHNCNLGSKLSKLVALLRSFPADERAIIFVQFADLMQFIATSLQSQGLPVLQVIGSVHTKTGALEAFQQEHLTKGAARILMLNMSDESASGANLTCANHAIFLHPLLVATQNEYTACETQAFGRIRRYGQARACHLYRMLVDSTLDTETFAKRTSIDDSMGVPVQC